MTKNQGVLINLLSNRDSFFSKKNSSSFFQQVGHELLNLTDQELATLYVDVGYLQAILLFLIEQHWLCKKENPGQEIIFEEFVTSYFQQELSARPFLHEMLKLSSLADIRPLASASALVEQAVVALIKSKPSDSQKVFSTEVLVMISELFEFENQLVNAKNKEGAYLGVSLYRTYDSLDLVFELNYQADIGMKTDLHNTERLYEGAGVGVQSGYSTVLTGLRYLKPKYGARFIDLGSGYGRLGLVIGLLRPDIEFIGYEFVEHRVKIAQDTAQWLGLQDHVHFHTQDLSNKDFQIPEADIYYLYDPFSEETYLHVLSQLIAISKHKNIAIVTKGNAKNWLVDVAEKEGWPEPQRFLSDNLCIFNSANI